MRFVVDLLEIFWDDMSVVGALKLSIEGFWVYDRQHNIFICLAYAWQS